jgi:hypothetical protein
VFLLVLPLIEGIGVLLGACIPGATIVEVLGYNASFGALLGINCMVMSTALISSSSNLYTAAVSLPVLVPRLSQALATLFAGIAGIGLACLPLIAHYETVLSWLALATSGLGALILGSYTLLRLMKWRVSHVSCALAWIVGVACGATGMLELWSLTGEPLCDVALVTAGALLLSTAATTYSSKIGID